MTDNQASFHAGVDVRRWAGVLRRAHELAFARGRTPSIIRGVVADSWERCTTSGLSVDTRDAPLAIEPGDARDRWEEHPLSRATAVLRGTLASLLYDARHIVVVADADGTLLWAEGHPDVLRASEAIQFTPGHMWSEDAAGTNAVGTALAAGHPVQIFSAEHYRSAVHAFQCSGAPIRDPDSGAILGVIDVTGSYQTGHPHNLALVETAARLVEEQLRGEMLARDARTLTLFAEHVARHGGPSAAVTARGRVLAATHPDWRGAQLVLPDDGGADVLLPDGTAATLDPLGEGLLLTATRDARRHPARTRLTVLGRPFVTLRTPDGEQRLTPRHGEIVTLLALHPDGLTGGELAALLYGEGGHEVAVRAELHRLRDVLGDALATRPYRLVHVDTDLAAVRADLAEGDIAAARSRYAGPLLPGCGVAAIATARAALAAELAATAP